MTPPLEPSLDRKRRIAGQAALGGSVAGFAGLLALGVFAGSRPPMADRRFAGLAPGVVARRGALDTEARRDDVIPVRFSPPELTPAEAGALLEKKYRPTQLAATLVELAVAGSVRVTTDPLTVVRTGQEPPSRTLAHKVYQQATKPGSGRRAAALSDNRLRGMAKAAQDAAAKTLRDTDYVVGPAVERRARTERAGLLLLVVLGVGVALGVVTAIWSSVGWGSSVIAIWFFGLAGLLIGLAVGVGRRKGPALNATGTALRDQTIGFREYIATAEADQLDFEADADIFRRYLPWAVLFGLTRRWTRVCQQLADAGRIPPLDVTFWGDGMTAADLVRGIGRLDSSVGRASFANTASSAGGTFFSGGGSGGSSGFSGGSSGGGGGGGTSAGSW
ncbi:DUF2207 family protein [Aestuariimicrobium ganziense]|uniref:DUF2207 family protein n=1 Tax=Aestuariimicrobium ganziense TaxID=2773677 RepID=UPI001941A572|nr:DUF2207 domain-containing protein [Aestuariimicrobium ganziense]